MYSLTIVMVYDSTSPLDTNPLSYHSDDIYYDRNTMWTLDLRSQLQTPSPQLHHVPNAILHRLYIGIPSLVCYIPDYNHNPIPVLCIWNPHSSLFVRIPLIPSL